MAESRNTVTRYAQVGLGSRARFFYEALATTYSARSEIVAFCDSNRTRMGVANDFLESTGQRRAACFGIDAFDELVDTCTPEVVIVTSIDRTHDQYIVRALELGCDVITEKPMTIDESRCQRILDAASAADRSVRVAFNYRFAPHHTAVRELIASGTVGTPTSVHFEWLLDTSHGADYFRRWHRDKRNSGGLLVHKATHHFDLVNFWLADHPDIVMAFGDLRFYGKENAERRGTTEFYSRSHCSGAVGRDPFALDLAASEPLKSLYLDAEHEDGYYRDQSVFGDGISIEDTMAVVARYRRGAFLTYSLSAYSPLEGFKVGINGDAGRLELHVQESPYVNAAGDASDEGTAVHRSLKVFPHFASPHEIELADAQGSHGGGDQVMLEHLFGDAGDDPLHRLADQRDGAWSVLVGIAANISIRTGVPVKPDSLISW